MFKNQTGKIRSGWLILLTFLFMYLFQGIFMIPGFIILGLLQVDVIQSASSVDMLEALNQYPWISLFIQGGGTVGGIVSILIVWCLVHKKSLKELGFRGSLKDLGFGLLLGEVSITIIFLILWLTGNVELTKPLSEPMFTSYTISFFILFILVGFFEEMFFRGYVMSIMGERGNRRWVIYVVSALFFSIVHGTNPNVSIIGLINIALVGLLFAYMYDVTNSIWLPIGYHITWNYFQGNVFGFAVSGTSPHGIFTVDISNGNELLTGGAFGLEGGILTTLLLFVGFMVVRGLTPGTVKR